MRSAASAPARQVDPMGGDGTTGNVGFFGPGPGDVPAGSRSDLPFARAAVVELSRRTQWAAGRPPTFYLRGRAMAGLAGRCRRILGCVVVGGLVVACGGGCSTSSSGGKPTTMRMPWTKRTDVPAKPAGYKGSKAGDRDPFLNPSGKDIPPPESIGQLQPRRESDAPVVEAAQGLAKTETASPIALVAARRDADDVAFADYCAQPKDILKPDATPRAFKYIIVHQSNGEAGNLTGIDRVHREQLGWESCGFHFVVGNGHGSPDGEIEVGARWRQQKQGAHVTGKAVADFNLAGIGICLVGDFDKDRPSPRQLEATRTLIAYLMRTYNIPPYRVMTHDEVNQDASHGQKCPGSLFQLDQVLSMKR